MRATEAAAESLLEQYLEQADGARPLRDAVDGQSHRRDTLIDLLGEGDDVLVPCARHLGDTADAVIATARRIVARGARLSLLREDLDGKMLVRAAEALSSLISTPIIDAPEPRPEEPVVRRYGRTTPEAMEEIVRLSAQRAPISQIAKHVGLSVGTIVRIRRMHKDAWAIPTRTLAVGRAGRLNAAE